MKSKNQSATKQDSTERQHAPQPQPFTPGITPGMVRDHAFKLYRDKLTRESLTLEDWVLAEKDLVQTMQTDNVSS